MVTKYFLIVLSSLFLWFSGSSDEPKSTCIIYFTDKNFSSYSLERPSDYLSENALLRREKHNIQINTYDLPVSDYYITQLGQQGFKVKQTSKWLNAALVETRSKSQIDKLEVFEFISKVNTLKPKTVSKQKNKFDSYFNIQSVNKSTSLYGHAFNQINMVSGIPLHNAGYMGQNITIAVLDAGFVNIPHLSLFDELYSESRLKGGHDLVNDSSWISNEHPHGTQVLSIMAGNDPGLYVGTAPMANYYLVRTEDAASEYIGEEFFWALGAEFADSVGADIINSSLGYTTFDNPADNHTYDDMDGNTTPITIAADIAASKGILVVNSAGNSGNNNWFYIGAPADGDSVLSVGGVDSTGIYTSFSSKGPSSDGDIKPNVSAQAEQTWIANPWVDGVGKGNGTSFSGPIIAGMAACLWQKHHTKTNMQILSAIEQSAHQYSNPDSLLGYGIPDFALADVILSGTVISDFNKDELLNIYPNPTENNFSVVFYSATKQSLALRLIDISGRLVEQKSVAVETKSLNQVDFNTSLANGNYIISIESTNGTFSKKLIVQ